jgi:hypothetical protein
MIPALRLRRLARGRGGFGDYSKAVLGLGPLAYWPLNETSGTAAVDLVGAHNGTYTGVDLAQSQPPFTAPLFDGTNDYCNIYSAWLTSNFTGQEGALAYWAKVSGAGVWADGKNRYAVTLYVDANNTVQTRKSSAENTANLLYQAGGTVKQINISTTTTAWAHYAMTWSKTADQMIVYYNGAQSGATQTGLGTFEGGPSAISSTIGSYSVAPVLVFSGWLAHAALWNRALTATEVANLYAWGGV